MTTRWGVIIHNHSNASDEYVLVSDGGKKRNAWFSTEVDAAECARVINNLRIDSAFAGCTIYRFEEDGDLPSNEQIIEQLRTTNNKEDIHGLICILVDRILDHASRTIEQLKD